MLIACPECYRQISDRAGSCPHCGTPMGATRSHYEPVHTVQQTAKKWKAMQFFSLASLCFGMLTCAVVPNEVGNPGKIASELMVVGGICVYIFARVGAWWHHG